MQRGDAVGSPTGLTTMVGECAGVATSADGAVVADVDASAVSDAIAWLDARTVPEAGDFLAQVNGPRVRLYDGNAGHGGNGRVPSYRSTV